MQLTSPLSPSLVWSTVRSDVSNLLGHRLHWRVILWLLLWREQRLRTRRELRACGRRGARAARNFE